MSPFSWVHCTPNGIMSKQLAMSATNTHYVKVSSGPKKYKDEDDTVLASKEFTNFSKALVIN